MTTHLSRNLAIFAPALVVLLASCSREVRPEVYPVRGSVTFQEKPALKAVVVLRPVSPGLLKDTLPHGEVGPDGTFQISTYVEGDGAPVGEYIVTITWPEVQPDAGGGDSPGGDLLEGRYSDVSRSPWRVQIKDGTNELGPFRVD